MLIPVYIVGFILGGLVLFAIAQRIRNRRAKIWLRTIGVLAGPLFFILCAIFIGWELRRSYEMEWLTGKSAAEFLNYNMSNGLNYDDLVVLKRVKNQDCYDGLHSREIARYLEGLPTHTVMVRYRVIYDFFQPRAPGLIEYIGSLGHPSSSYSQLYSPFWKTGRTPGPYEKSPSSTNPSCFAYFTKD